MKSVRLSARKRVVLSLAGLTLVSVALLAVQITRSHSYGYSYLLWNLFLAWIPLGLSAIILRLLDTRLWSNWLVVLVSFIWLVMLPNSFYMISDYIHIQDMASSEILYGIVMFTSFIFTAALVGFSSLYIIHAQLRRRLGHRMSGLIVTAILFVCSFAIYLGRDLRWNSWDILVNPAGILFDISDRLLYPFGHPGIVSTTILFFVLLGSLYIVGWQIGEATRETKLS